jgi:hypothetical protein
MASNQPNSQSSEVSNEKSFHTANGAPSFYSAEGPASQNLSGFENQVHSSSAAESAPVAPIVVDYNVRLASNPNMIQSIYIIVKSAGATIHPKYNENDITVTGGAAYRMYAEQFMLLPKMPTSDIDMVWWTPKREDNDVIRSLVPVFCERIALSSRIVEISEKLIRIIQPLHPDPIQTIDFQVIDDQPYVQAGTIINSNIHISILINGTHLIKNLCEISIHNGISSQRFNMNHRNLRGNHASSPTKSAEADPIYCDRTENSTEKIYETRVPTTGRYVIQQLFAYKNLRIQATDKTIPKSHIRLYRVLNFCILGNPQLNYLIDIILSRSVIAVITHLILPGIQKDYIDEVQKHLDELRGLQPFAILPLTRIELQKAREYLQSRKGGSHKKRTIKRKKNKSKTKKRSTR